MRAMPRGGTSNDGMARLRAGAGRTCTTPDPKHPHENPEPTPPRREKRPDRKSDCIRGNPVRPLTARTRRQERSRAFRWEPVRRARRARGGRGRGEEMECPIGFEPTVFARSARLPGRNRLALFRGGKHATGVRSALPRGVDVARASGHAPSGELVPTSPEPPHGPTECRLDTRPGTPAGRRLGE